MLDTREPTMHIDIGVVRNLLKTRIDEGKDRMKDAGLPNSWKKKELYRQEKLKKALDLINEAMKARDFSEDKEDKPNENTKTSDSEGANG